jgi:outer membrane lipopolysaccharide assembly protein LptE/RlpB
MKHFIKQGLLIGLLALTACGFHLRGSQYHHDTALSTIAIQPDNPLEFFQRSFRRYLRQIDVTVAPAEADLYVVRIQPEHYVREVLVIGTDAQAKQEYLIYTINFEIISPYSGPLGKQSIQVNRMLNVDFSRILGQNQEEEVLINEMRQEASMQIYYRLNVVAAREQEERKP